MRAAVPQLIGSCAAMVLAGTVSAGLVGVVAEDDPFALDGLTPLTDVPGYNGERVINVYAVFDDPGDQCVGVLGIPGSNPFHVQTQAGVGFVNDSFFNSDVPQPQAMVDAFPSLNLDSFMTLGRAFAEPGDQLVVLPLTQGPNTDPWPLTGGGNMGWVAPPSTAPQGGFGEADLFDVLLNWGTPGPPGDVNGDSIVDVLDAHAVLVGWGPNGTPTPQTVAGPGLRVLIMRIAVPVVGGPAGDVEFQCVVVGGSDGVFDSMPFAFSASNPACGPAAGPCNAANGSPGCDDPGCCDQVCAVIPNCCDVTWDAVCAGEAINQGCAPVPGCGDGSEIRENEPCGTQQNGGCNSTPTEYVVATCGESYGGTVSAEAGEIDTDWYQVDMPAGGDLIAELRSEFTGTISIVEAVSPPGEPCPGPVAVGVEGSSFDCIPGVAMATDLPPGLYCIIVAPAQKDGLPCGGPNTGYVMTPFPVPPVGPPAGGKCIPANRGACCLPTGNCMVMLPDDCAVQAGTFEGLLSTCSIPPCQACCLGDGTCVYTSDATFCTNDLGGTLQGVSVFGGGAEVKACCFDDGRCCRRLTQVDCESDGGTFQAFNNCENCPSVDACPWDLNDNGTVDVLDLVAAINAWGACQGDCPADFDGNQEVGVLDLVAIIQNWGPCPPDTCSG